MYPLERGKMLGSTWHQFHRKPTSGRGVLPPQHEQEAGRRVAGHQEPGKMHSHERAEVFCDCDPCSFFCMNITTSSGFQERAACCNSGSNFETNLRLGPVDLVKHSVSREETEPDRILIWMIDMQKWIATHAHVEVRECKKKETKNETKNQVPSQDDWSQKMASNEKAEGF